MTCWTWSTSLRKHTALPPTIRDWLQHFCHTPSAINISSMKWSDFRGSIKIFLEKLAPGQTRIYCKVIPEDLRSVDKSRRSEYFYANQPVGKNLISSLLKEGADMLGLPNPKKFAPHCLRSYMITKVANGKGKYISTFFLYLSLFSNIIFSCIFLSVDWHRRKWSGTYGFM